MMQRFTLAKRPVGMATASHNTSQRLSPLFACLLLVAASVKLAAQPQPAKNPDIERIAEERDRSSALAANLAWSADGKSLCYPRTHIKANLGARGAVSSTESISEVWSIDAATGKQKILVPADEITRVFGIKPTPALPGLEKDDTAKLWQLQSCAWAPDGHALLLATGASLAWYNLDSHASRLIVKYDKAMNQLSDIEISPDGRSVTYIQDHTLWLADPAKGVPHAFSDPGKTDLYEGEPDWSYRNELGLHKAYWWSPDSSSIAWLEFDDRAVDHYSFPTSDGEEQSIAYPKPGAAIPKLRLLTRSIASGKPIAIPLGDADAYIPRVQWTPDNKHLAVQRLDRAQKTLELLLADTATGKSHSILTEKDAYWINLSDDLKFLKDGNRFLWTAERSDFRHLYLYDISGKQLAQLTHGNWEVSSLVGVDETTNAVYFLSTEATPLERHLYSVHLDGSGFTRITQQKGTHNPQLSPSASGFLDTYSNRLTRPSLDLLTPKGEKIATITVATGEGAPAPAKLPTLTAPSEFFTFKSHLGMELHAQITKPADFSAAKQYPVIVYVAGGPGEQIVRDAWGGDISLWLDHMAQNGYIVFAVDPRGTTGRGHHFEEPIHLRFSASEMADVRDGVLYLQAQPWVNKARIGICGWGYGGFLALHGMMDRPILFKAGFAGSPVTDWHLYDSVFTERYLESPVVNQDGWLSSSPVENSKFLNSPLLLAQSTLDEKIHLENSLMLLQELLDESKYADILLLPGRKSLLEDRSSRLLLFQRITDFFMKNL